MHLGKGKTGETSQRDMYLLALNQAQTEYDVARSYFGEAVEPEIIDEAIYLMEAARKKYSYFLKKVRDSCSSDSPAAGERRATG